MLDAIAERIKKHWGYGDFRPLQREAIQCTADGRDSLVIAPTGGGKSLCYQAPAVAMPGVALVVSPLLSLMKDQVDALGECGVAAARIDSTQDGYERSEALARARHGTLDILYLSPERLMSDGFLQSLRQVDVSFVAIDEAHCVSMWGHDFRPEYRMLGRLRDALPGKAIHAYTATATPQVRRDIIEGLNLRDPAVLVGSFDRPNLSYAVHRRHDRLAQVTGILERHRDRSGIIYCLSRRDVDELSQSLTRAGRRAAPYHAGMESDQRQRNQEDFLRDRVDIIVATVAFGMGIDKSNVRFVIHATMPKSIEHYQQESGRAGRDGLPAECVLLWSGRDYGTWKQILADQEEKARAISLEQLNDVYNYCTLAACRRKTLLQHFDQRYERGNCAGCDVCLGGVASLPEAEALPLAQKILSCVVRLGERFGGDYTASVLEGSKAARIGELGHDRLSTYGLLNGTPKRAIREYIDQLVAQNHLALGGEYATLSVTPEGWRILRGEAAVRLFRVEARKERGPRREKGRTGKDAGATPPSPMDEKVFERLRALRRQIADEKGKPPFIVFSDASLRDMAARRPLDEAAFMEVSGVGEHKCAQYAPLFIPEIRACLKTDNAPVAADRPTGTEEQSTIPDASDPRPFGDRYADCIGVAEDLPSDLAENLDHHIHEKDKL
jgi:ATP-dependent DNA helicase RecQ